MNRIGRKGRNVRLGWHRPTEAPTTGLDKVRMEYISDFNKGSFFGVVSRVPRAGRGLTSYVHGASHGTHHNHSVTSHYLGIIGSEVEC